MRIKIEKTGKSYREDALAYQKKVIEKEKELIKLIQPEINRLELIEEEVKVIAELEIKKALLPIRVTECENHGFAYTEGLLLEMGDIEFRAWINTQIEAKNERIRLEHEAKAEKEREEIEVERKALEDERNSIAHEKEKLELAERVRIEERERAERMAKEQEARVERDKVENERKTKEEQEALENKKRYQNFLTKHDYVDDGNFKIENDGKVVTIYKKLGSYKI